MVIIYGIRLYGTVDKCGSSRIATRFIHLYGVPLIPIGSVMVLEEGSGNSYRGLPLGLHLRSVVAAYARVWSIAALFGAVIGLFSMSFAYQRGAMLDLGAFALLAAVMLGWGWGWAGRLTLDERAQRLVYAEFAGYPVDVALLRDGREPVRQRLEAEVSERARELGSSGYRIDGDPGARWWEVALSPVVNDRRLVAGALTLSRIQGSLAPGSERATHAERHAALWKRLNEVDPQLRESATLL